ncbi:MAG: hypothetical protein IJ861_02015 [Clostridia bacterium]|nr:hypothetical protein [Clostridia bacterium]
MIIQEHLDQLTPAFKQILTNELKAGNTISETFKGGFSMVSENHIFVFLKYPFKTPIRNDLPGVEYYCTDDRHYWKAEYYDQKNQQTIACHFD